MSWLNLNDSLNTIRGQITNFTSNVMSSEHSGTGDLEISYDLKELHQLCIRQQEEIKNLTDLNDKLSKKVAKHNYQDEIEQDSTWSWSAEESKTDQIKTQETITELKKRIVDLEREKVDLVNSLDQLDQNYQQNTEQLISIKEKIENEKDKLKENYDEVYNKWQHSLKLIESTNSKIVKDNLFNTAEKDDDDLLNLKYKNSLMECQTLKSENRNLQNDVRELKSTIDGMEKLLNDTNNMFDNKTADLNSKIDLMSQENKALRITIQANKLSLREYEIKKQLDTETAEKLALLLEGYEKRIIELELQLSVVQQKLATCSNRKDDVEMFREEIAQLTLQNKHLEDCNKNLQKDFVDIITKNVRIVLETNEVSDIQFTTHQHSHMTEFDKQIKQILKMVADYKAKCIALEKELFDVKNEKTNLINEKNFEIEKLIQNSEILTQEIIKKTQDVRDYEEECSELMRNNDILINELSSFKSTGLQTISEFNEDNVTYLESQLEIANKKIEDLVKTLTDFENSKGSVDPLFPLLEDFSRLSSYSFDDECKKKEIKNTEELKSDSMVLKEQKELHCGNVDNVSEEKIKVRSEVEKLKELSSNSGVFSNIRLRDVNVRSKHELTGNKYADDIEIKDVITGVESLEEATDTQNKSIKNFNELQKENEILKEELPILRRKIEQLTDENAQLQHVLDKMKTDAEISEYQLTELNVYIETLNEDIDKLKTNLCDFEASNKELKAAHLEMKVINNERQDELKNLLIKENETKNSFVEQVQILTEKLQNAKISETALKLQSDILDKDKLILLEEKEKICDSLNDESTKFKELQKLHVLVSEENKILKGSLESLEKSRLEKCIPQQTEDAFQKKYIDVVNNLEILQKKIVTIEEEKSHLIVDGRNNKLANKEAMQKCLNLEQELENMTLERNKLIEVVRTKHEESLTYHSEIQRLSKVLTLETEKCQMLQVELDQCKSSFKERDTKLPEIEVLNDQNSFLKGKCEILARNLLEEQANNKIVLEENLKMFSEKEVLLTKQLERLKSHLIEVEEHYTQELINGEQKCASLQSELNEIKQREKESSTMYTSASIRFQQQVESLQKQVQLLTSQREELANKLSDAEDYISKNTAALSNLQFVLEQFQKDKENDVIKKTDRIYRQIQQEKQVQNDLKKEISKLQLQLDESKEGLQAALRISDHLELSKRQVQSLRDEVSQLNEKLQRSNEIVQTLDSQTEGKVDKTLLKNLVIGFLTSNSTKYLNKDQLQILKIIATVLDFNQQDHEKVDLNNSSHGFWLTSLLVPTLPTSGERVSHESISQAFVKFLENESKPLVIPSLLEETATRSEVGPASDTESISSRHSPVVLSEIVLPTFADFAQSRNSSSILKDVLKDSYHS